MDLFGKQLTKLAEQAATTSASSFKKNVLETLQAYMKDKTVSCDNLEKNASSLKLHAASLPHDHKERSGLIKLAEFAETVVFAGRVRELVNADVC